MKLIKTDVFKVLHQSKLIMSEVNLMLQKQNISVVSLVSLFVEFLFKSSENSLSSMLMKYTFFKIINEI